MISRLIVGWLLLFSSITYALDLELTQGINAALPIGIGSIGYQGKPDAISSVIEKDLRLSGQFKIVQPPNNESMSRWRSVGADSALTGYVTALGNNRYEVVYELRDVQAQGRLLLAKSYQISGDKMRGLAHHISDEVYQKLTGERGIFSTRIAYILVNRTPKHTQYYLEVAEVDGSNPQRLLIMSPSWSPDGRQIAYVSFEKRRSQIYTVMVETGQRRLITSFSGINGAPAWSPDAKKLAVVLSKGGAPNIYSIDLSSGHMKQLTYSGSIDTEPRFSPDGKSLLFTSGRSGGPQIYRLNLSNGSVSRVTYDGTYNARASYTPDQRHIVMLHREGRAFSIGVQEGDNGAITTITDSEQDESPSVAPNGRLILYATHEHGRGMLGIVSLDGSIKMRLPTRDGDVQEPAWSPFLETA